MRILFHCRNTTGLGHLMRGKNIATAIRQLAPDVEIFFTGNRESVAPLLMEFPYLPYLSSVRVEALQPNVVVVDTLFPNWKIPPGIPVVYVMRKIKSETLHKILEHPLAARAELVLIPHSREEFSKELPLWIQQKAKWVGPILRDPDVKIQNQLREKYHIQQTDFVLTSTAGGGGKQEESVFFFRIVSALHASLLQSIPGLHHFVVLGPYSNISLSAQERMTIVRLEPELNNLIALSNAVIAEGGYNTVHEIRMAKVPAVFIPSRRKHDNQEERVRTLAEKGLCAVFTDRDVDAVVAGILKVLLSRQTMDEMKACLQQDALKTGNFIAAKEILKLAHSRSNPLSLIRKDH